MHSVTRSVPIMAATFIVLVLLTRVNTADAKEPASAMMAPIYAFAAGDASGSAAQLTKACLPDATIIDEFAPYQWSGPGSVNRYAADVNAWLRAGGLTNIHVAIEAPRYWDAKGDGAWVSVPATFWFEQSGKRTTESGMFAFVLARVGSAWKVKSSAWTTTSLAIEH